MRKTSPSFMVKHLLGVAVALALPLACGGASSSDFDDRKGDAGDPGTGGSNTSGTGGSNTSGTGGSNTSGTGGSNTSGTGGTNTSGTGGTGGTNTSGTGGIETGGSGGTSGTSTGGTGGETGGTAGVGGGPDPRCPPRPPSGACDVPGAMCRYDMARMCLCLSPQTSGICTVVDPRCTAMAPGAGDRIADGGAAIPISTSTCTCSGEAWLCTFP